MKKYILILLIITLSSCHKNNVAPNNNVASADNMSSEARQYVNYALDIMQNNSINRYKIEWNSFRENAINNAGNAQTPKDTYNAIRFASKNLGDNHSFFIEQQVNSKAKIIIQSGNKEKFYLSPKSTELLGIRINSQIGFIRISAFSGSGDAAINYADYIQSIIKGIDTSTVKGWIVDLRHNTGGNMWPMLAGVGPILGDGLVGYFIDPDKNLISWSYEKGKSILDSTMIVQVNNYYNLFNQNPYVAVLTDSLTASSGEAITIAFIGRQNTKSFGNYTRGLSTANQGYTLSDGAIIELTVAIDADRNKNLYGSKIKPDDIIMDTFKEDPTDNDKVVKAAINWLESNIQ